MFAILGFLACVGVLCYMTVGAIVVTFIGGEEFGMPQGWSLFWVIVYDAFVVWCWYGLSLYQPFEVVLK